ncbi:PqiC family protein [Kushneria sp. EE4]
MMMPFLHASLRSAGLAAVVMLAGCAGQATEFHRYTLPLADQRTAEPGASLPDSAPTLAVSSVRLADYLDGQGVVYQTSDIEVNEAQTNLWADNLSAQLTRSLQRTLGDRLRDHRVLGETLAGDRADTGVRVTLSQFQGRYDGMAVLAGQYQLRDAGGNLMAQHHFDIERPLEDDGYPALVRTLSQGWENVGEQIADEIARQERSNANAGASASRPSTQTAPAGSS